MNLIEELIREMNFWKSQREALEVNFEQNKVKVDLSKFYLNSSFLLKQELEQKFKVKI